MTKSTQTDSEPPVTAEEIHNAVAGNRWRYDAMHARAKQLETELAASAAEVDRLWTALKRSANAMDFAYEQLERHELEQTRLGSKAGRILSELRSCFAVIRPALTAPPSEEQKKKTET